MLHKKFGEYDGHLDKAEAVWYIEYARARHFPGEIPRKWSQDHFLPPAEEREAWMHQMAAKGVRVFITNPRCVKTGLDFLLSIKMSYITIPRLFFTNTAMTFLPCGRRAGAITA